MIENLEKQKQSMLSVESVQKSFKDIENLKHPTRPELTVVEALPIFPDDRILENTYSHISFDRPPMREAVKLPFLQERSDEACHDATRDCMMRVAEKHGKQWYSMYTPDKEVTSKILFSSLS